MGRAGLLALFVGLFVVGCAAAPPMNEAVRTVEPVIAPTEVKTLAGLVTRVGLTSVAFVRPSELLAHPGFVSTPARHGVVQPSRLERYALVTGLDLRRVREAIIATWGEAESESTLYLVRHSGDATNIEKLFRERLTRETHREADRPDVVRIWGKVGLRTVGLVRIGPDVVGFQEGGDMERGALRIAALYALGKLQRAPTLLADGPLRYLHDRLASAPFSYFVTGGAGPIVPGAGPLLGEVTTGFGLAAWPEGDTAKVRLIVTGDFANEGSAASNELLAAWQQLARSELGAGLGLDKPVFAPIPAWSADDVSLDLALDLGLFAKGLENKDILSGAP